MSSGPNGIATKARSQNRHAYDGDLSARPVDGWGDLPRWQTETLGWSPACSCDAGDPVPAVVLDCFSGSGTTGLVADRLGRSSILIDLSPEYSAMAKERIVGDCPLFATVV